MRYLSGRGRATCPSQGSHKSPRRSPRAPYSWDTSSQGSVVHTIQACTLWAIVGRVPPAALTGRDRRSSASLNRNTESKTINN